MWKKKERWTVAALLLAMVVVTGLCWYILYIRQQFYDEGTRNLLETYEQVDKSFAIFSRSNWNMLNEWGKSLQAANEEGLAEERLRSYEAEREIWRYSSVYLFNENCEYWSIRGKHEKVDHLWTAFEEMYRTGKPTVSSYIMRSGERRVVYAAPIAPVEIDGTTYTSLAVSYRNKTIEELIGGSAYGGQSDCYIIHPDGDVMLSEEPKSEIEDWMDNLFDYLQKHAQVDAGTLTRARQDVAEGRSGHGAGSAHLGLTAALRARESGAGRDDLTEPGGDIEGVADGLFVGLAAAGQRQQNSGQDAAAARRGGSDDALHAGVALGGLESFGGHCGEVIAAKALSFLMGLLHLGCVAARKAASAALGRVIVPAGGLHHLPEVVHHLPAVGLGEAALGQIAAEDGLRKGNILAAGSGQHFFTG